MGRAIRIVAPLVLLAACEDPSITVIDGPGLFDPPRLDFGTRGLGVTHELGTKLTAPPGAETLQVTEVTFEPDDVYLARTGDGSVLRGAILTRGKALDIRVIFAPRTPGDYDGSMLVVFQDSRAVRLELEASGAADGSNDLTITPMALDFPNVEVGREVIRTVEIHNRGDEIARIRDVRMRSSGLVARDPDTALFATEEGSSVELADRPIAPGERIRADVHFRPRVAGSFSDGLLFVLQTGVAAPLSVTGLVAASGSLRCEPSAVDFGTLVRGQVRDTSVRCEVVGGAYTLASAQLSLSSSQVFSIVNAPPEGTRYNAGETIAVGVRFDANGLPAVHGGDVVMRSALGQDYLVSLRARVDPPPLSQRAISVNAAWDTSGTDLDLHLVRSGADPFDPLNDCYYRRKNPDWGAAGTSEDDPYLDRDDVDGFGPEEINLLRTAENRYDVYVHFYEGSAATLVDISVFFSGNLVHRGMQTVTLCGDLWHVGRIEVNGGVPSFIRVDAIAPDLGHARCR